MNSKFLIGIVVVVVLIVGGVYFLNTSYSSKVNTNNTPTQNQGQSQTNPAGSTQTENTKNAVTIQNFAFSPSTITVKVGDSITWTNQDTAGHSATADDNSFDTGILSQGQSKSITFSKAGTYTYHCSVHPMMKATVVVQ